MTELFIQCAKEINLPHLIAIGLMFWFFYNRLNGKIEKGDERLEARLSEKINESKKELSERIDRLSNKIDSINERVCRIEGSLATQGHCLFTNQKSEKKVE